LMSQVGEGLPISVNRLTFDDSASLGLPYIGRAWPITNGVYKPTDGQAPNYNFFPPSAPGTNVSFYSTVLSAFNATVPNGTWSLYVDNEDSTADTGQIANGWTLNLVTAPFYDGVDLNDTNQLVADWDGDGMPNVLEYALGTNPSNPADGSAGAMPSVVPVSGSNYLELKYKQRVDAAALKIQYVPEVSSDETTWLADSSHLTQVAVTPFDSEFNWVTVRDLTPITSSASQFIRLRIVYNSIEATSPVWVGSETTIQGNGGAGSTLTLFSQRMVRPIAYAGKISSVQDALLTDTNSAWTDGQFGTNGTLSFVEFDNGWSVDIANSSSSSNSLILAGSLSSIASAGDKYRIRPHFTVASLFGTNNETGLTSGANPSVADNVLLLVPETQQMLTLFYYSNSANPGFKGWVRADTFTPDPDEVIYPEQGVIVTRIVPSNITLSLSGPVKSGVTVAPVQPGYNLLGTLKSFSSLTLSNLNLFTTNNATGVAAGVNPSAADNLIVINPGGSVSTYFYYYKPGVFQGWVNAGGFTAAGNVPITAGSAFFIFRQPAYGSFPWTIPAE
jgi:hypothetical protein